ncbi:hypothetical protein HGRIS_009172 [Hohenbuehelia grisea]|uniref:DNA repair protein RAD16 n=1 Tax=Hohenbuehelia grisea TaxID=104357 RepID=A0ABR3J0I6_9AGAR
MPRVTRQSARKQTSPSPIATPTATTTNVSPIFSSRASIVSETPSTSDYGAEALATSSMKTRGTKRGARSVSPEESVEDSAPKRASKRRVVSQTMYVEITQTPKKGNKGKGRAATPRSATAKGRGKAVAKPPPGSVEEISGSEAGIEFDEKASIYDSEDSGSDFQESDFSEGDAPLREIARSTRNSPRKQAVPESDIEDFEEVASEAEDLMLRAAVELSLDSVNAGEGSSSKPRGTARSAMAARAAAAAERRLSRTKQAIVDDDEFALEYVSDEEDADESLDEETFSQKRGKIVPKKASVADTSRPKSMTVAQLRRLKREERQSKLQDKRANRKEEQALMRVLGRKLTHAEKSTIALHKHHPELRDVWGDLEEAIPVVQPEQAEQPANLKVTLLPFQRESLSWMRKQEKGIWNGGMLADEMGMGKTIQIIALLVTDMAKPNLVVAPTVAIMQWRNEIASHTDGMKVLVWHGASRESDIKEMQKYDVVLTTYAVLESCFRKQESGFKRKGLIIKEPSPVHRISWNRVVLDEAHNIKERSTNTAKAAFELKSKYRWCLSGTPLQNRVGELYSLVRFLGGDPFSYYFCKRCDCKSLHWQFSNKRTCDDCGHSPMQHTCFWNNEILTPIQKHGMEGPGKPAFKKLKILLDRMMLRRTKLQRADDLGLPPRTVIVRRDYFSPEEKELYLSLFSDAKRQFTTYLDQGTVLNNYSNIFSLLTRMRQMACHPDLVLRSKTNSQLFAPDADEATVCRLCNDIAEDAIQSKCRHIFDRECIKQYLNTAIEQQPDCPVCHLPLTIDLEGPALELEENVNARQGILGRLNLDSWRSSSKIEALVEELSNLRLQDATTKSLVFSQFVNFLDLIAFRLQRAGFNICRLEGTMTPQARDATIQHFMNSPDVTVFLVSLKAGGVALNLTEASRVYLMDSWWNPAVEYQAMDRIHRLGQHRPVKAIKLVVEDSIESRIVQLQEKKSAMVDATLSTDDSAMGRLTPEDLGFLFRL